MITEDAYVHRIRRYIAFHQHRHPRQLAESDVNGFLTSLAVKEHVARFRNSQDTKTFGRRRSTPMSSTGAGAESAARPTASPVLHLRDRLKQPIAQGIQ
jgi:hypothetical protein